jgi:hypothetical protein
LKTKLAGIIEADETYIGGKSKWRLAQLRRGAHGRPKNDTKIPVVALIQRGGQVRAFPMPRVTARNLGAALYKHVDPVNSSLMTDEAPQYIRIGRKFPRHESVKHGVREYVRGNVHVNTAEGFFGLMKRGITGVYHHVGKGHLGRYVDEFTYRYNTREMDDWSRAELAVQKAEGKRLVFEQPVATKC